MKQPINTTMSEGQRFMYGMATLLLLLFWVTDTDEGAKTCNIGGVEISKRVDTNAVELANALAVSNKTVVNPPRELTKQEKICRDVAWLKGMKDWIVQDTFPQTCFYSDKHGRLGMSTFTDKAVDTRIYRIKKGFY